VYREIEGGLRTLARIASLVRAAEDIPGYATGESGLETGDDYLAARRLVESAGIRLAAATPVETEVDATTAAAALGYPVVLKALGLLHKSDAGGVALGLRDADDLRAAFTRMAASLGASGYVVEKMVSAPVSAEVLVGCRRDARFGPLVVVGLGGVYTEIFRDAVVALAPAESSELEPLIRTLRGASLVTGARGRPALDIAGVADAAAALSRLAAAHPEIAEIEINPLLVGADGVVGLDARVVFA
jgi:acetate---CoA ligase (ADP-forming)